MARRKKITPGSVFARKGTKKLYVEYRGRQYATGYDDTQQGRMLAQTYLERLHDEYMNKGFVQSKARAISINQAWEQFTHTHLKAKHKETAISYNFAYRTIVGTHTHKEIHSEILSELVRKYMNNTKHSTGSKNIVLRSFRVFCRWCEEEKMCSKVSFKNLIIKTSKKVYTYTQTQVEQILHYWLLRNIQYYYLFSFLAATGARLTETLELMKVDDKGDILQFRNKVVKRETDVIPITNEVRNILNKVHQLNPSDKIFWWNRTQGRWIRRQWKKSLTELGITDYGIHALRKTFASQLIYADVDAVFVKDLLRHRDINTTLEYYKEYQAQKLKGIVEQVRGVSVLPTILPDKIAGELQE